MKKAQTWILEFVISFLLFLFFLVVSINLLNTANSSSDFEIVLKDANHISSVLISDGTPFNWVESNVQSIGLKSYGRIDLVKLSEFDKLDYVRLKSLLGVSNDFIFYFENESGIIPVLNECYRGFNIVGCDDYKIGIEYDDLSFTNRIVILNSTIVELVVVSWK